MKFESLKKKKDFAKALKSGKRIYCPSVTVVFYPAEEPRFAVCVGKKYGKSVARNRLKRLLREAFRFHADKLTVPFSVLLIPKPAEEYSYETFRRDIGVAVEKGNRIHA